MENSVIVVILLCILIPAIAGSTKHLKGEGDCCGGPKQKAIKKKIAGKPIDTVTLKIEGMMCNNCRIRLENALNGLDNVVAKVSLENKEAKLKLYQPVERELLINTVEAAGYKVIE